MKLFSRIKVLLRILRQTHADQILSGFLGFTLLCALVIWLCEPAIPTFRDALWYCYAVVTTVGFGDITVTTPVGRIASVLVSVYGLLCIAIVTGVVVNYYTELVELRNKESFTAMMEKLEHLPELSKEKLQEISERIKKHRLKR